MAVSEWKVPPVEEKVETMEAYAVPLEAEYLQVADSSVATETVVWVVPAVKEPEGEPEEMEGAVLSGPGGGLPPPASRYTPAGTAPNVANAAENGRVWVGKSA